MPSADQRQKKFLEIIDTDFDIHRGHPIPLGATILREGINFAILSRHATSVQLVLYVQGDEESILEIPLDPRYNKTGDIWHIYITGLDPGIRYGYRVDRQPNDNPDIHKFDPSIVLLDPYAKAFSGAPEWG